MTTIATIQGATLSADCCDWKRGAQARPGENSVFIPESSGSETTDRLECCHRLPTGVSKCCSSTHFHPTTPLPSPNIQPLPPDTHTESSPLAAHPPSPVVATHAPTSHSKGKSSSSSHSNMSPHSNNSGSIPDYVSASNAVRGGADPLSYRKDLEESATSLANSIVENNCQIPTNEKPGFNTLAMIGCDQECSWANIINSWAAETGTEPCQVAHRVTLLNPEASSVGCSKKKQGSCLAAVCAYDKGAIQNEALGISASMPTPSCNRNACCGALPCRNTLC